LEGRLRGKSGSFWCEKVVKSTNKNKLSAVTFGFYLFYLTKIFKKCVAYFLYIAHLDFRNAKR